MTPYAQWEAASRTRDHAATLVRQGIVSYELFARDYSVAAEQIMGEFHRELNLSALERAWRQVMTWYRIGRNGFRWVASAPNQRQTGAPGNPAQRATRGRELPHRRRPGQKEVLLPNPFSIEDEEDSAPSMTMTVTAAGAQNYRFTWKVQRLLLDNHAVVLLLNDLLYCYGLCARNQESELPLSAPDSDANERNPRPTFAEVRGFWRRTFKDLPPAKLSVLPGKPNRSPKSKTKPQPNADSSVATQPSRWAFPGGQGFAPSLSAQGGAVEFITHHGGRLRLMLDI